MTEHVRAAIRTGPGTTELREFPVPRLPDDGALMKVEVAGICGTDVKIYGSPPSERRQLFEGNTRRVYPRLDARLAATEA